MGDTWKKFAFAHAKKCQPEECCGMLIKKTSCGNSFELGVPKGFVLPEKFAASKDEAKT